VSVGLCLGLVSAFTRARVTTQWRGSNVLCTLYLGNYRFLKFSQAILEGGSHLFIDTSLEQ
jgi:hypothetical protein